MESFIAQIIVGLATGGIYALLVLGMNLLVLVRNIVHHSYSHIVVLTMAMGWLTLTHTGNNIPLCIVVMLVSAIVFTIATERCSGPCPCGGRTWRPSPWPWASASSLRNLSPSTSTAAPISPFPTP